MQYLVYVLDRLGEVMGVPCPNGLLDVVLNGVAVGADEAVVRPDRQLEPTLLLQLVCVLQAIALRGR